MIKELWVTSSTKQLQKLTVLNCLKLLMLFLINLIKFSPQAEIFVSLKWLNVSSETLIKLVACKVVVRAGTHA